MLQWKWVIGLGFAGVGYWLWDKEKEKAPTAKDQKPTTPLPPKTQVPAVIPGIPATPKTPTTPDTPAIPTLPAMPMPPVPVSYARVSTNDPAPSGDLYIVPKPGAAGINGVGAEKNGIVEVLEWNSTPDGVWSKIAWGGGPRLKAVTGYAKRKYLAPIPSSELPVLGGLKLK